MSERSLVTGVELSTPDPDKPLLLLGPSLGTAVAGVWSRVLPLLADRFSVVGWDLPGHGTGDPITDDVTEVSIADLAAGARAVATDASRSLGHAGRPWHVAGVSIGGAVGLQLLLDHPEDIAAATLVCTGARIGTAQMWAERADRVDQLGTPSLVESAAARWFAPGFIDAHPRESALQLASLQQADARSYAALCRALATFDVSDRLSTISAPVTCVAGADDQATPVESLAGIAAGVQRGTIRVLDGVAHLAPVEAPEAIATSIRDLADVAEGRSGTAGAALDAGMAVRREVLGDDHVARAQAGTTSFTAPFQDLISRYAWGGVWTRPGLDRRSRSIAAVTALIAGSHWAELPMHVRAARRNGLTDDEIREVILQSSIYCSVPQANHAFAIAADVLAEHDPGAGSSAQ